MLLFLGAAVWLVIASVLGMVATLKFHSPNLLADCAWLTYGRVHPAATNALLYGFGVPAGLGVLIWLTCHLGRAKLAAPGLVIIGWLLWNLGVKLGVLGILAGDNTGFDWLEMPRYASVPLFLAYLLMAVSAMLSFHARRERQLYISQWFLITALFWFPWIYSTGNYLLVAKPVRGVAQSVIDWWYVNNLTTIWFGFVGLATVFYFMPKMAKRPLHSHYLGIFAFWGLVLFGSWAGIPAATPVPAWIPALSALGALLALVPILAVAINVAKTLCGTAREWKANTSSRFIAFGASGFVLSGLLLVCGSCPRFSEVVNFTWFMAAQSQLALYGFFAMTMFGAMYHIIPRLLNTELPWSKGVRLHFWLAAAGIVIYALPLLIGGLMQGMAINDATKPYLEVVKRTLPFLRASTTGDLLMAAGHVVLLMNLAGVLYRLGRPAVTGAWAVITKPAGVAT